MSQLERACLVSKPERVLQSFTIRTGTCDLTTGVGVLDPTTGGVGARDLIVEEDTEGAFYFLSPQILVHINAISSSYGQSLYGRGVSELVQHRSGVGVWHNLITSSFLDMGIPRERVSVKLVQVWQQLSGANQPPQVWNDTSGGLNALPSSVIYLETCEQFTKHRTKRTKHEHKQISYLPPPQRNQPKASNSEMTYVRRLREEGPLSNYKMRRRCHSDRWLWILQPWQSSPGE